MKPLTISTAKKVKNGVAFTNLNDTVTIETDVADLIVDFLFLCNGRRSVSDIRDELSLTKEEAFEIVETLTKYGIVVDSTDFYTIFHDYSRFPLTVANDWDTPGLIKSEAHDRRKEGSPLETLIYKRKSTRSFTGKPLTDLQLDGLLDITCYKTAPSGGAHYQVTPHLVVLKDTKKFKRGIYSKGTYSPLSEDLFKVMIGTYMTDKASAVLVLTGNIENIAYKYANRAYRLALLEAGHLAQNVYLYGAENNIGVCEYGGFNDREIAKILKIDYPRCSVLTTLIVGEPSDEPYTEPLAKEEHDTRVALGDDVVSHVTNVVFNEGDYTMPRYVASARYKRGSDTGASYGTGKTLVEARFKALAEAQERYVCSLYRTDPYTGNPFIPLNYQSEEYMRDKGLSKRGKDIRWVTAYQNNTPVSVPADEVFFPLTEKQLGHKKTRYAHSTGVATHFSKEKAIENGLLELIERDAIAVTWYTKTTPPQIGGIPRDIRERIDGINRTTWLFDITQDSVPVVMCVITSPDYPMTVAGYGAHYNKEEALRKAFNEAELMLHSWKQTDREKIKPWEVKGATTHGDHNAHLNAIQNTNTSWLFSGVVEDKKYPTLSLGDLIEKFEPVVVGLANITGSDLQTVRVLSNKLMPIEFGYGAEHRGHPRISELGLTWKWEGTAFPHLLA